MRNRKFWSLKKKKIKIFFVEIRELFSFLQEEKNNDVKNTLGESFCNEFFQCNLRLKNSRVIINSNAQSKLSH